MVDFKKMTLRNKIVVAIQAANRATERPDHPVDFDAADQAVRQAWLEYDAHLNVTVDGMSVINRMKADETFIPGADDMLDEDVMRGMHHAFFIVHDGVPNGEIVTLLARTVLHLQGRRDAIARILKQEADCLNAIRWLMGYIENGGGQEVTIVQDDATKSFNITAGLPESNQWWFADSFRGVLDKLVKEMESDPERFL